MGLGDGFLAIRPSKNIKRLDIKIIGYTPLYGGGPAQRNGFLCPILVFVLNLIL